MIRRVEIRIPRARIINLTPNPVSCYTDAGDIITLPVNQQPYVEDNYYLIGEDWSGKLANDSRLIKIKSTGIGRGGVKVSTLVLCLWPDVRVFPT